MTNQYHCLLWINNIWNKILRFQFIEHQLYSCTSPPEKHAFYMISLHYTVLWFLLTRTKFSILWISALWNIKYSETTSKTLLESSLCTMRAEGLLKSVLSTLFLSYRRLNHHQMHMVKLILKKLSRYSKNYSFQQVLNLQDKSQILATGRKIRKKKKKEEKREKTPTKHHHTKWYSEVPPKHAKV